VKLLAAAIDHRVSPGITVWGTAALAAVENAATATTVASTTLPKRDTWSASW
jgi:2-methylcitrate dehydratase PrpD